MLTLPASPNAVHQPDLAGPNCCWSARSACGSWAAATRDYARYLRCSTGRRGRPVRRPASCWCGCSSTWMVATARWSSASTRPWNGVVAPRSKVGASSERSSRHQLVKASGLRIPLMWLGQVPWAGRHWALPVLTVLAPSTRYYQQQGRRKLTDWARQMVMQSVPWCWWATTATPCWICSTAANPSVVTLIPPLCERHPVEWPARPERPTAR